jgi:hypothetical protein
MPTTIQPSFAKGEIAPALYGRVDTAMYAVGLATARNFIIRKTGGADNRPGQKLVAPVANHSYAPRLRRFQFKTTDTYILEFGHLYMRVIRNDGLVLTDEKPISSVSQASQARMGVTGHGWANGTHVYVYDVDGMDEISDRHFLVANSTTDDFRLVDQIYQSSVNSTSYGAFSSGKVAKVYQITTPYEKEHLQELKFKQSADVITITHPKYPTYELTRLDHDDWQLSQPSFEPSISWPTNLAVTPNTTGTETYSYTVTAVKDTGEESLRGLNPTTVTIIGATQTNPVRIQTSAAHNLENDDEVYIVGVTGMEELNGRRFTIGNKDADEFDLVGEDGTEHTPYGGGGTAQLTFVRITNGDTTPDNTISWSAVSGAQKYLIYRRKGGGFGLINETVGTSYTDENNSPDMSSQPPIAKNPFRLEGDYPGAVGFHEQRRVFGGSDNKPDTSIYSRTGNYSNFTISSPIQADDAITATLPAGQVNQIRHYVSGEDLLVFSSGSETRVNSGTDSAFGPESIKQKAASVWGCSHLEPIRIGPTVLFVHESELFVRSLGYSIQVDNYTGTDMTLLAGHLFGEVVNREQVRMIDWAYARSPGNLITGVRSDGVAVTLTYEQEQEVMAWSRLETDGDYERVEAIRPSASDKEDAFYFVVRRVLNGRVVRFIERSVSRRFNDIRDAFFVDAGATYDEPVAITNISASGVILAPGHGLVDGDEVDLSDIVWVPVSGDFGKRVQPDQLNLHRYTVDNATANSFTLVDADFSEFTPYVKGGVARKVVNEVFGLWHLEGSTVAVVANGSVMPDQTVTNGRIAVEGGASRIHVGLRYVSDLGTLDIEVPQVTAQGLLKRVSAVTLMLDKSRECFVGPDEDTLVEMKIREDEDMGSPVELHTGKFRITIDGTWNTKGRVLIRQFQPLPLSVLAVIPEFSVEEA